MNIVLLSGGSGKRLWPLSNEVRSKQFIKIFKTGDGSYESMVQRVYRQIHNASESTAITVATSKAQVSSIHNQLGDKVSISIEPFRRDTFPAIALATAYLKDVLKVNEDEPVVVCPVDPYVNDDYYKKILTLPNYLDNETKLVLMGIAPTYPSEKYGYIIPKDAEEISKVKEFKEKPTKEVAENYIKQNALWNCGVFSYRIKYVLEKAKEYIGFSDYDDLFKNYENLQKISFDYAVVEKESSIKVVRFSGEWKDIGTWNTLAETMPDSIVGNAVMNETCKNVHILNELDRPILAMGLKDVIISASPEGILVSDKEQSSYIKPFVDKFEQEIMFAEKSWGNYKVIDSDADGLTIKVTLNEGHSMNYHSHKHRDEVWIVIEGEGETIVGGEKKKVKTGDVIKIEKEIPHTIKAITQLKVIECQIGKDISAQDKQKHLL